MKSKDSHFRRCAQAVLTLLTVALLTVAVSHVACAQSGTGPERSGIEQRRIYVPVDDLDVVLAGNRQGVLLTRDEFEELARQVEAESPAGSRPNGIVVSGATYSASISGSHLLLDARITFRQFGDGWHALDLPFRNLAVEAATVNGLPAQLGYRTDKPAGKAEKPVMALVLFHQQRGEAELVIRFSTVLESVGNDRAARFGLRSISPALLSVQVPPGKHLQVGSQNLERPAPEDQPAVYDIPVGGKRDLLLLFNDDKDEQRTDTLTFATTGYGLNVSPGEVTWQASTAVQVFGTTLNQLLCTVPNSLEITDVASTGLESWNLTDDPDDPGQTLIVLNYRQPFDGRREAVFRGVLTTGYGQAWAVPSLSIRSVTSHVGRVVIQHPPGVRLRVLESAGTRTSGGSAGSMAFDVWREDFRLALETRTRAREIHASVSTILDFGETSLMFHGVTQFETYFEPLFDVRFRLPAEWQLEQFSMNSAALTDWKVSSREAGWNDYRVPLPAALMPGQESTFTFSARQQLEQWPVEAEPVDLTLPVIQVEEASVVEGTLVIKAGEDLDLDFGDLTGLDPATTGVPGERLGFVFQSADYAGEVTVHRRPSRITASTLAFTRLDPEHLNSHLQVTLDIAGGGLRELQIGLSASAGENLRFRMLRPFARIVEQQAAEPQSGVQNWTLLLDRRLRGEIVLAVDVVSPRGANSEFQAHQVTIPGAERVSGFAAFEAAPEQQLNLKAVDEAGIALLTVDPVDVPAALSYVPRQRVVEAFQHHVPGYQVTLSEKRFERGAVPTAVCHVSHLQTVVGSAGELQHRAVFEFVAVGAQSLLIDFPVRPDTSGYRTAALWAAMVDGSPVEVRRTRAGYIVPLPGTGTPDARRSMTLFYQSRMPALMNTSHFQETPPQISVRHSSGERQPLEILNQCWRLFYPPEMTIVSSEGVFQPAERVQTASVLGDLRDSFTKLNRDTLQRNGLIAAILILISGGVALSFRKLGVGLSGCLGAVVTSIVLLGWLFNSLQSGADRSGVDFRTVASQGMSPSYSAEAEMENATVYGLEQTDDSAVLDSFSDQKEAAEAAGRMADESDAEVLSQAEPSTPPVEMPQSGTVEPGDSSPSDSRNRVIDNLSGGFVAGGESDGPAQRFDELAADNQDVRGREVGLGMGGMGGGGGAAALLRGMDRDGARLSLALDLQIPDDLQQHDFQYTGNQKEASGIALRVTWHNRNAADLARLFLIAAVTLLLWLTLKASFRVRAILVTVGMTLPLALISVAPPILHNVLDGVFLGSVLTLTLWLARAILNGARSCFRSCCCASLLRWVPRCCRPGPASGLILFAATLGWPATMQAQPAAPVQQAGSPGKTPVSARPDGLVIPYEAGTDPIQAGRILLTREHFLELWNRANPDRKRQSQAPVPGLVADALYRCTLVQEQGRSAGTVAVEATVILYSFRDEQVVLPLDLGRVALNEARLNGQPAPVRVRSVKGRTEFDVVLEKRGQHTLDLKLNVPAAVTGRVGQFTVPVLPIPSGRVVFQLPETGLGVRVNGTTGLYRLVKSGEGDAATESIVLPAGSGSPLTFSWRPPEQQAVADAIVHIETKTAVSVEDAGISQSSRVGIRVPQGVVADLAFDLPEEQSIRRISGPNLAGWELNEQRRLRVFFSPAIDDQTTIDLDLFLDRKITAAESVVEIATPAPVEVTRESELITVFSSGNLQVRSGLSDHVTRIDVAADESQLSERPVTASPDAAPRVAWRHVARPYRAQLILARQMPRSKATVQHAVRVSRRRVEIASLMAATLNGSPRAGLSFALPVDYLLIGVNATSMQDWFVTEADGANPRTLTIEFDRPLTGQVEVILKGYSAKEPDDLVVEVFVPEPFEVSSQTTWAAVWIDDAYNSTRTGLTAFKPVDPGQVPPELRQRQNQPLQYAFRSTAKGNRLIEFETVKSTPDLEADSVVVVSVTDSFIDYTLALNWKIEQAAVDSFTFLTPQTLNGVSLAGKLKFTGKHIREFGSEVVGDHLRWTVTLRDAARERYFLLATVTLPPAATQLTAPDVRFVAPLVDEFGETMDFVDVDRQRHFVMLVNQSLAQVDAAERPSTVEVVPSETLPIQLGQDLIDQAAETLRIRGGQQPSWTVRRSTQQSGAPASVNLADLTLAVAADGTWRGQAVYTVRNRRRQFLAVRMPENSELLSLFVQGRPSRPVRTAIDKQTVQLIALPRQSDADLSFQVRLVYSGAFEKSLPQGFMIGSRDIDLPAPHVITQKQSREFGIPVARTLWAVYLPDSVDASVIEEAQKTNLQPARDETQKAHVKTLLKDYQELLTVARNKGNSYRRRKQASSNLKQIGLALHSYNDGNLSGKERSELEDAQQQIVEQERQTRIEDAEVSTEGRENSAADEFDAGKIRQSAIDRRNSLIYGNNYNSDSDANEIRTATVSGVVIDQNKVSDSDRLEFRLNIEKQADRQIEGKKDQKSAELIPEEKKLNSRLMRRKQSLDNLANLNARVEQQLPAQQSAQQAAVPGNVQAGRASGYDPASQRELNQMQTQTEAGSDLSGQQAGGIGGGLGMMQANGEQSVAEISSGREAGSQGPWTVVGGLSLAMDLPVSGTPLEFTKVSGQPRLALRVRSRELLDQGVGLIWTGVWLVVAVTLIILFNRMAVRSEFLKPVGRLLFVVGLVSFTALSGLLSGIGFLCFLTGILLVGIEIVRSRPRTA